LDTYEYFPGMIFFARSESTMNEWLNGENQLKARRNR